MNCDMSNIKSKFRELIIFKRSTMLFIFIYFILGVGITYGYLAFRVEEEEIIVGNIISIDADLEVELVVGNTTKLVPMLNDALPNAIIGKGSENGPCIDAIGNLSCQIYKITLINNGSRLEHVTGSIKLYAKEGPNNAYSNLKWRELTNLTTVKEDAVVNGMDKSILVSDVTLQSKETKTWYIALWLGEIDANQVNSDKGLYGGTVTFEVLENIGTSFIEKKLEPNARSDENIDFGKSSKESATNGIYVRKGTENNTNPIYYYRGSVDNNNMIFADTCWKIVRTTETGGLKLIYNGVPSHGECNNTGTASQIGTRQFNSSYLSPAYVGYMYSTVYNRSERTMSNDAYYYGNSVTYSNGTYTLVDTITSGTWSDTYRTGLNNNHYTCFSTTGVTCSGEVYYVFFTDTTKAYYITLTNGKDVDDALFEMFGSDDANQDNYNTISSTIKGSSTTAGSIDYWYYNNIEQKGYEDYLEDTVWCNDRTIYNKAGWEPNGGSTTAHLTFGGNGRLNSTKQPSLTCSRVIDSFTVEEANGNGKLEYPVGLLTSDEIMLAGGRAAGNNSYYLYTGQNYWAGSPSYFYDYGAYEFHVNTAGYLNHYSVNYTYGVRPSVSLKPGFSNSGGNGSAGNPYIVQ